MITGSPGNSSHETPSVYVELARRAIDLPPLIWVAKSRVTPCPLCIPLVWVRVIPGMLDRQRPIKIFSLGKYAYKAGKEEGINLPNLGYKLKKSYYIKYL